MGAWQQYLMVALGGAAGSCLRFFVAGRIPSEVGARFPVATFVVNMTGSFVLGCVLMYVTTHSTWDPRWRLLLAVGFCGGLTTFSTFAAETSALLSSRQFDICVGNAVASLVGTLVAYRLGEMLVFRLTTGGEA